MKLVYYLQPYLEKSERARIAANTRWEATKKRQAIEQPDANAYANAEQMQSDCNADAMQVKEIKESKENKEEKSSRFTPPTFEEISLYCKSRNNRVDPSRFIDFYSSKGWIVGKVKMVDWKAAVRTWEKKDGFITEKPKQSISYGVIDDCEDLEEFK
jgi:hypothetical protein